MIPKSKNPLPESLVNQISQTMEAQEAEPEVPAEVKKSRVGQINMAVPLDVKTKWKVLFAKNNIKITQGIMFAMEHLIQEIEDDEVILTVGGVMKKKK